MRQHHAAQPVDVEPGAPSASSPRLTSPARPQTPRIPKTATIAGSRNGAPSSATSAARPGKRRRASARAAGTARAQLRPADHRLHHREAQRRPVRRPEPAPGSARVISAAMVPSVSPATSASASPPPQRTRRGYLLSAASHSASAPSRFACASSGEKRSGFSGTASVA